MEFDGDECTAYNGFTIEPKIMNMVWCHIAHLGCEKGVGVRTTYGPNPRSKGGLKIFFIQQLQADWKKKFFESGFSALPAH